MKKENIDIHIGKRLRMKRTMMGLSQDALAKAVGVTFQQVQKYEKGTNAISASRLLEFSLFLKVPVGYFFEGLDPYALSAGKSGKNLGASEAAVMFQHDHAAPSDRESLEMMKAFTRISEQGVRKRLSDLVRAIADNKTLLD